MSPSAYLSTQSTRYMGIETKFKPPFPSFPTTQSTRYMGIETLSLLQTFYISLRHNLLAIWVLKQSKMDWRETDIQTQSTRYMGIETWIPHCLPQQWLTQSTRYMGIETDGGVSTAQHSPDTIYSLYGYWNQLTSSYQF